MGGDGSGRKPGPDAIVRSMTVNSVPPPIIAEPGGLTFPPTIHLKPQALRDGPPLGAGHTIQDEGSNMTARTNLNFSGSNVTLKDDSGNDATIVSITGSGTETDPIFFTLSGSLPYVTLNQSGSLSSYPQNANFNSLSGSHASLSGSVNLVNAAGKLLTLSGSFYALPVGSNAQVLTADSTVGAGMKWATPAGGATIVIGDSNPMSAEFSTTSTTFVNITNFSGSIVTAVTSTVMAWIASANWNSLASKQTRTQLLIDETPVSSVRSDNDTADIAVPFMCFGTKAAVGAKTVLVYAQGKVNSGTGNWFGSEDTDRVMIMSVG